MTISLVVSADLATAMPGAAALQASLALNVERELSAAFALLAELNADLPALQASLAVSADIAAGIQANLAAPPSLMLAASLAYAADLAGTVASGLAGESLTAGMSAQLTAQLKVSADLAAKVSAKAAAIAGVQARIEALKVARDLALSFEAPLTATGVRVYFYTGPLEDLGTELNVFFGIGGESVGTPQLSARDGIDPSTPVSIPLFVTDNPTTGESFGKMIKVA